MCTMVIAFSNYGIIQIVPITIIKIKDLVKNEEKDSTANN